MIFSPLATGFAVRSPPAAFAHMSFHAAIDARGGAVRMQASDGGPVHVRVVDGFLEGSADDEGSALDLRSTFDERFAEPRQAHADRFCWDYWHVPGQYTLHRTQAASYFSEEQFSALTSALTEFGQQELGCREISPPWLSFYVDGCEQVLHADVPQGPFAYVLSLTPWEERTWRGGETTLLRPDVLDYWRGFDSSRGLEVGDLLMEVEPEFNRLLCFDARVPHGVRRVDGVRDPRAARLVLHGWFTEPVPHFEGGLDEAAVEEGLAPAVTALMEAISPPCVVGLLAVRLEVSAEGKVTETIVLSDTLVVDPSQQDEAEQCRDGNDERAALLAEVEEKLGAATFAPCAAGPTTVTLPLIFD